MQSDGESGPASEDGSVCGASDTTVLYGDNDISDPIEENFLEDSKCIVCGVPPDIVDARVIEMYNTQARACIIHILF
jgi:hypothetical protein